MSLIIVLYVVFIEVRELKLKPLAKLLRPLGQLVILDAH